MAAPQASARNEPVLAFDCAGHACSAAFWSEGRILAHRSERRSRGQAERLLPLLEETLAEAGVGWGDVQRLAVTQHLANVRLDGTGTASLRAASALELVNGPFERVVHTGEVRRIASGRGRYNIPHVGLFLWRLQSYPVIRADARPATAPAAGGFTFHPLGIGAPLFNLPRTETAIDHLAREEEVPEPLRRRALFDELEARREAGVEGREVETAWFGEHPALQVFLGGELLPPEALVVCDLDPWRRPPANTYALADGTDVTTRVAVDPPRGRLALVQGEAAPESVRVSYAYGFSGDLGGGPYDRRDSVDAWLARIGRRATWQAGVTTGPADGITPLFATLAEAVAAWNEQPAGTVGVIAVTDSRSYAESLAGAGRVLVPEGSHLLLIAAQWPAAAEPGAARTPGHLLPQDLRPHLRGGLAVRGTAPPDSANPGTFAIDGMLVEGALTVEEGSLGVLRVAHCTLVPGEGGITVEPGNTRLEVEVERCITGPVQVADDALRMSVRDSILDAAGGAALGGPAVDVEAVTLFGSAAARTLEASNSIFGGPVQVARRQQGCVRFSWLAPGSLVPRRYECHPASPGAALAEEPQFTARTYGHPAYAQLSRACPVVIISGADDEGEMGAFHFLKQTQRMADLRAALGEHLRVGLEAGLFFAT